jgi:hypothetical protein
MNGSQKGGTEKDRNPDGSFEFSARSGSDPANARWFLMVVGVIQWAQISREIEK